MPKPWTDSAGNTIGLDVHDYVSGTIGLTGSDARLSVYGGDVYVSGSIKSVFGFSGSLTRLNSGVSYLAAGTGVTITSSSTGQITISSTATGGGGGDPGAQYLVLAATASLPNERVLTPGTGLLGTDAGAGSTYTIFINDGVVATVSGTTFTGQVALSGNLSTTKIATGSVVYSNVNRILTGSQSQLFWDETNLRLGIGTATPGYKLEVVGDFAATTKSFVIPHPRKDGWKLRHGSLEGPENGVYFRGNSRCSKINLPSYWKNLIDDETITVAITPIGRWQRLYVSEMNDEFIIVKNASLLSMFFDMNYSFIVFAMRKDAKFQIEYSE